MRCPFCHFDQDRVMDSRASEDGYVIRRRRECLHCKRRYTSYERLEELGIKVVKKDGVREPFSREKIRAGLAKACWKRPISDEQIEGIIGHVESYMYAHCESEIESAKALIDRYRLGVLSVVDHTQDCLRRIDNIDGELIGHVPATFSVEQSRLRVIVPGA